MAVFLRLVVLLAVLLVTASPAAAQEPPDLEASMLVKEDLPDGFSRRLEFEPDVPPVAPEAFAAHDGIARRLQVWTTPSMAGPGAHSVFEDRVLFPSAEAARAYLLAAEDLLSERESEGFVLDPGAPPIGDLHRRYELLTTEAGDTILSSSHLFTVGPLVAKVFVTGGSDSSPVAHAIAEAAAARMEAAVLAVTPPTPIPGPIASGGPDLSAVFQRLLASRISASIRTCHPIAVRAAVGELAGIYCPIGDDGEVLTIRQMDTTAHLLDAFAPFRLAPDAPAGTCRTGRAVEPHVVGGVEVGELSCFDAPDGTRVFIWTDERHDTLAWIVGTQQRPFAALHDLYRSSLRE